MKKYLAVILIALIPAPVFASYSGGMWSPDFCQEPSPPYIGFISDVDDFNRAVEDFNSYLSDVADYINCIRNSAENDLRRVTGNIVDQEQSLEQQIEREVDAARSAIESYRWMVQ